jgi:hypothetical protein
MNITLSADEAVIKQARKRAEAMGKSLNQLVREYLQQLAGGSDVDDDITALRRLSKEGRGRSGGWRFNREEIHERS